MDIHWFDLVHSDCAKYLGDSMELEICESCPYGSHRCGLLSVMDQEKALEIEEIERLQCELQAQEDPEADRTW